MASSRWKRFAFFDRRNLSLPPPVARDLLPSKSSGSNARGGGGGNIDHGLDPDALYRDDYEPTADDRRRIGRGDYFSLVAASHVALPASLSSMEGGEGEVDDVAVGAATRRGAGGDGAPAMKAGLLALHGGPPSPSGGGGGGSHAASSAATSNNHGGDGGALVLLFASSRSTSRVHCVDVTVRCTPANPHAVQQAKEGSTSGDTDVGGAALSQQGHSAFASSAVSGNSDNNRTASSNTNKNAATANPEDLDGWRGHYDPFASCDGVASVSAAGGRKDVSLLGGGSSATTVSSPLPPTKGATKPPVGGGGAASKGPRRKEQRILDEHLDGGAYDASTPAGGGGGSLFGASPFAADVPVDASSSLQQPPPVPQARIVGLATCAAHSAAAPAGNNNHSNHNSPSTTLYVAAVTDAPRSSGIVVHANPHLMLSSLPPSSSASASNSSSSMGAYSSYYKPSGAFNYSTHGKPRCVSLLPGVVGVGTDAGVVLVYVFKGNDRLHGSGGGGRLSLVAEIPAPRASAAGGSGGDGGEERKRAYAVSRVELIGPASDGGNQDIHRLFVSYRRRVPSTSSGGNGEGNGGGESDHCAIGGSGAAPSSAGPAGGVCCYDLGGLRIPGRPLPSGASANAPVVSARYDMDGRDVGASCLCDGVALPPAPPAVGTARDAQAKQEEATNHEGGGGGTASPRASHATEARLPRFAVARGDGLHLYSPEEKVGVVPVELTKLAVCALPPPPVVYLRRPVRPLSVDGPSGDGGAVVGAGASYALVATTDAKSGRDAVDVYDTTNKIVGCHVLLSPGHRALRAVGAYAPPVVGGGMLLRGGRSSAVVLTSGGSIVTLTEKVTPDKVDLLVQKNLYGAAISMAYSDPQFYRPEDITALYRRHAEHLYRRGEFGAAMDQYILTIGSLEPSHVVFRYLDAPKIPLAVKYLEALRTAGLASTVHDELLRTCYLKLGNVDAASKIVLTSASSSYSSLDAPLHPDGSEASSVPISRTLLACADDPSEMLAAVCSLDAPAAVEALVAHGVLIARSLPRETAGVVIALCDGSYSPTAMADAAAGRPARTNHDGGGSGSSKCEKYPISLFANAFMENPKLFRLILSHCRRNDCVLTPMLRRTLLELTLEEWNAAKRTGDMQVQKLRHDEAINMLSENHVDDMGDYEALVIVQAANFTEGEILLYERLNMIPMLLEEYAKRGGDRSRRQMLAMCEAQHDDPDLFAEVLAHFVIMARERLNKDSFKEEASVSSESDVGRLLHDIHEALVMAREDHVDVPAVRILRVLAGEGPGMFNSDTHHGGGQPAANPSCGVPLSAAMDYVGAVLDDSNMKIHRLQHNVEEYSRLCSDMESEINALLSPGMLTKESEVVGKTSALPNVDIDEMYANLCQLEEEESTQQPNPFGARGVGEDSDRLDMMKREDFWREMEHSDDPFETIAFYISKGYLEKM